jgi:hypothetical protein
MVSNFGAMFFDDPYAAFAGLAALVRPHGRLAFLYWQDDMQNEVFAIPLCAFGADAQLPWPSAGDLFVDPRQIPQLLSRTGWEDIQVVSVMERAWIESDVDDVMAYIRSIPMICNLTPACGPPQLRPDSPDRSPHPMAPTANRPRPPGPGTRDKPQDR